MGTVMPATIENSLGYLCLTSAVVDNGLLTIKANQIVAIVPNQETGSVIFTTKDAFAVSELVSEIIEQIENVHPSML